MNGLFYLSTFFLGFLLEFVFNRYLNVFGVAPNFLLLLVLAIGFMKGPLSGELMGFAFGLAADAMGIRMFGLNCLLLTLFGYMAGKLKRRIDAERPAPQVVIACVATLLNAVLSSVIYGIAEEMEHRVGLGSLLLEIIMNGFLAAGVFWLVDQWLDLWRIEREAMGA